MNSPGILNFDGGAGTLVEPEIEIWHNSQRFDEKNQHQKSNVLYSFLTRSRKHRISSDVKKMIDSCFCALCGIDAASITLPVERHQHKWDQPYGTYLAYKADITHMGSSSRVLTTLRRPLHKRIARFSLWHTGRPPARPISLREAAFSCDLRFGQTSCDSRNGITIC